jgi:hypothetical protein
VIQRFGILNAHIPEDHEWYGVPYPGTYMLGADGLVADKTFFAEHGTRESVNDMLQESFEIDELERGRLRVVTTPYLEATAYFASPTIRHRQYTVLTVEVSLADGTHVVAPSAPAGYIPVELSVDADGLVAERTVYPTPEELEFETLGEKLPAYTGQFKIKAHCLGDRRAEEDTLRVDARLRYQACDDTTCYLPQTLDLPLSVQYVRHVR